MSRSSASSLLSYATSRGGSTYSDYSSSESETSHSPLSWTQRDARRSISNAATGAVPINVASLPARDAFEDGAVVEDFDQIFGAPQCVSAVSSSGYDYFIIFLLVLLIFLFLFFAGPYFSFSSNFFCFVFFLFFILLLVAAFYSCNSSKGPVCIR